MTVLKEVIGNHPTLQPFDVKKALSTAGQIAARSFIGGANILGGYAVLPNVQVGTQPQIESAGACTIGQDYERGIQVVTVFHNSGTDTSPESGITYSYPGQFPPTPVAEGTLPQLEAGGSFTVTQVLTQSFSGNPPTQVEVAIPSDSQISRVKPICPQETKPKYRYYMPVIMGRRDTTNGAFKPESRRFVRDSMSGRLDTRGKGRN